MMQLFLSTTFKGISTTDLEEVLSLLNELNIDGIELGSTHIYRSDMEVMINKMWRKRMVTHNFFPPTKDPSFVMNIASNNFKIRNESIRHAKHCIKVAANIGAEVYTIHPGFTATADLQKKNTTYDFHFGSERVKKELSMVTMLESLSELIDTAKQFKVKLAIETEGSHTEPGVLLMETMDEYDQLFLKHPENLYLNLNLAHTRFAAEEHLYSVKEFISQYYNRIALVELSHNNGKKDQHQSLVEGSYLFDYLDLLPNVPHILEFRNSNIDQIKYSIELMRKHSNKRS
jgi:sugar phosphate isomerase/epimerase